MATEYMQAKLGTIDVGKKLAVDRTKPAKASQP